MLRRKNWWLVFFGSRNKLPSKTIRRERSDRGHVLRASLFCDLNQRPVVGYQLSVGGMDSSPIATLQGQNDRVGKATELAKIENLPGWGGLLVLARFN